MPSDLDQLAQDADHQDRWGVPPTGNGLQDVAGQQQMTHQPEQPNPAQPYLDWLRGAARKTFVDPLQAAGFLPGGQDWGRPAVEGMMNFEQSGLTGVTPSLRDVMPGAANTLGDLVQSPSARSVFSSANLGGLPLAQAIVPAEASFLTSPEAREYFERVIGGKIPESEFLKKYWAGMHDLRKPNVTLSYFPNENGLGHRLSLSGRLIRNGETVGDMGRIIKPEEGYSYHSHLNIDPDLQGQGIAREIYRGQRDIYNMLGVKRVGVLADSEGAATWGKFGYKPTMGYWGINKPMMWQRYNAIKRRANEIGLSGADMAYIERALQSADPRGMWQINDLRVPILAVRKGGRMEPSSVGREILKDIPWQGEMNYGDIEQVRRQNDYLDR